MLRYLFRAGTPAHVAVYRLTGGRLLGSLGRRAPILLLTTGGRKTGKERTNPLVYGEDDGRYVVVASAGGASTHPAWYLNLASNPAATIEVKGRRLAVTAQTASPGEKARLWPKMTAAWPGYDAYQRKTRRDIPLVILTPVTPAA